MSGVVAIKTTAMAGQKLYYSLCSIQHRGQNIAGIMLTDGKEADFLKGAGLVSEVYKKVEEDKNAYKIGLAYVGGSAYTNDNQAAIEPITAKLGDKTCALAFDGNITNHAELRENLVKAGINFNSDTDSELIIQMIASFYESDLIAAIRNAMNKLKGAYSCILYYDEKVIAFRDYQGFRPLMIGMADDTTAIASENSAIEILGIEEFRDVDAGEIIVIDNDGIKSYLDDENFKHSHCIFEQIYMARTDANINNINAYLFRKKCGELLYKQAPVAADIVCPVPDSGIPAAIGYASAAGIPFAEGLVKNRYIGRTFIKPSQEERELAVSLKLNPIKAVVEGKRVILVDDSIVRGTTSAKLIKRIKKAGAKEVHFRVASPPFKYPCPYGVASPSEDKLLAAKLNVAEMKEIIGADSLEFIDLASMLKILDKPDQFCTACFTGDFPTERDFK